MHKKYFIDYDKKIRECGCCRVILPFSKFTINPNGYPRSFCKKCRSESTSRGFQEKKIVAYPDLYQQCVNEDCNWIFSKRYAFCTRCGSRGE